MCHLLVRRLLWCSFLLPRKQSPELLSLQAGGGGKDVISFLSSICNCNLWSETVNGFGLKVSPSSSVSKLCVLPPSVCFPVEMGVKGGACWGGWLAQVAGTVTVQWNETECPEHRRWWGGDCTSLTLPVTSWEIPRLPYVSPVVKSENKNMKVTCRYQKAGRESDAGAS